MSSASHPPRRWTEEEDDVLRHEAESQISKGALKDWNSIAEKIPNRTNKDCRKRWDKLAQHVRKGVWSVDEDNRLREAVEQHGTRWKPVADSVGTRNPDQCGKRWQHFLDPSIDHSEWEADEDNRLIAVVEKYGRNWKVIVENEFPGRSVTDVKNRYVSLDRRRQQESYADFSSSSAKGKATAPPEAGIEKQKTPTQNSFDSTQESLDYMNLCQGTGAANEFLAPSNPSFLHGPPSSVGGQGAFAKFEKLKEQDTISYNPTSNLSDQFGSVGGPAFSQTSIMPDYLWNPAQNLEVFNPSTHHDFSTLVPPTTINPGQGQDEASRMDSSEASNAAPNMIQQGVVARSSSLSEAGPSSRGSTLILEGVQPDTLNTIIGTLLEKKTKVKMKLLSPED